MITPSTKVATGLNGNLTMTWLVRVTLDASTKRWASTPVTISSNAWVGQVPLKGGLTSIDQSIDITQGGGVTTVGNCTADLNEIVQAGGYHTDFLPQSGGEQWVNRLFEVGIIYNDGGTLAETDITWLYVGVIDAVDFAKQKVTLDVIGSLEIDEVDLPKVLISTANYPNAPKSNIGLPLPILYGNFLVNPTIPNLWYGEVTKAAPCFCVDTTINSFIFAGHDTVSFGSYSPYMLYRAGGMNSYAFVKTYLYDATPQDAVLSQSSSQSSAYFLPGSFVGQVHQQLSLAGDLNTTPDFANVLDDDDNNYATVSYAGNHYLSLMAQGLPQGNPRSYFRFGLSTVATGHFYLAFVKPGDSVLSRVSFYNFNPSSSPSINFEIDDEGLDPAVLSYLFGLDQNGLQKLQFLVACNEDVGNTVDVKNFLISYDFVIVEDPTRPPPASRMFTWSLMGAKGN